ncbi:MAG: bifunctional oligoribonuclease/PAP phosphatase NrnA [Bacilli bacterium]|nr:bifunctional oligoribonuclease/PAP phosphatase NrnA [Bacilli bacterium]
MNDFITPFQKAHLKEYKAVLNAIREYKKIAIFRHIHPDFDALGSAYGLKEWIHANFMDKDIKVLGDNHDDLTPRLYPKTNTVPNSWFMEPFLAIILDTPNKRRIADPRYVHAEFTIKIDHHPFIEGIGDIELINHQVTSTAELLVDMLLSYKMKLCQKAARYFYTGIVGDSGRFEYTPTNSHTFEIADHLVSTGFDLNEVYRAMYLREQNDLTVISYILSHYQLSKHGVAYFILTKKELAKFRITTNQGKDHVNLFHYVNGIHIWCAITEDLKEKCFRVSLRSETIDISKVASKWRGGGHKNASGAKLTSLSELDDFINDLDQLIR